MKYKVSVIYKGKIDLSVVAPDHATAEKIALDEIDNWSEALFIERLELEIENIEFFKLASSPRTWCRNLRALVRL
jgi:hypothetical protein